MITDLIIGLAGLAGLAAWRFALMFHWRTGGDWRANAGGRHVMVLTADLAALLTLFTVSRVWPDWPGRQAVTLVLMAVLVYQLVRRNVLMDQEQARYDGRSIMSVTNRPRPVLIYGAVLAVLTVLTTSADATDLLPDSVLLWLRLATAIVVALGGALFVQARVTPTSDPRDDDGTPLRPITARPAPRPETWDLGLGGGGER